MSRHYLALAAVRVEGAAENVNEYVDHPDFRLVAAFCLGWVFFSGLRHVWFSTFLQDFMWTCKAISDRLRGRTEDPAIFTGSLHDKSARIQRSLHQCKPRGVPVLLLCMAFMLASLSSFLSLLTFYPKAGQATCTFVVAATAVTSQVARMFGFLMLGLDLSHRVQRPWELYIFWLLLGVGTVLSGVTAVIGTGQLHTPLTVPTVALCIRKRFLPTSLTSSILNFVLELYIIIRSLSLIQPPRIKLTIVQNARIVQAGSLLLFDLLVVVPNATYTALIAEFIPFSIGALGVLAAFNSSVGYDDFVEFVPTSVDVHTSRFHYPSPAVRALEDSTQQGDMSERVIRISTNAGPDLDIEAYVSPPSSPGTTRRRSMISLDGHYDETLSTSSSQPHRVPIQTLSEVQPEPRNPPRREKILSYSNPVWATFGAPPNENSSASSHSETSIDITRSSTSNDHSHERSTKFLSATSTILGSDIIRRTTLNAGKDRMRIRNSMPNGPNFPLSSSTSGPSLSRRAVHYSWLSRAPVYSTTDESTSQEGSTLSKGGVPSSRHSTSLLSSKSKHGSKSSRSSKSRKSSNSTRSTKTTGFKLAEESRSVPVWIGASMDRAPLARPPSLLLRDRVGIARGPRPPPSFPVQGSAI